jgi:excinuclease ABC subunit B
MKAAIAEVKRRRQIQVKYNLQHQITPVSIQKPIREQLIKREPKVEPQPNIIQLSKNQAVDLKNLKPDSLTPLDKTKLIRGLTRKMQATAKIMDFEQAAKLRDTINLLSD